MHSPRAAAHSAADPTAAAATLAPVAKGKVMVARAARKVVANKVAAVKVSLDPAARQVQGDQIAALGKAIVATDVAMGAARRLRRLQGRKARSIVPDLNDMPTRADQVQISNRACVKHCPANTITSTIETASTPTTISTTETASTPVGTTVTGIMAIGTKIIFIMLIGITVTGTAVTGMATPGHIGRTAGTGAVDGVGDLPRGLPRLVWCQLSRRGAGVTTAITIPIGSPLSA